MNYSPYQYNAYTSTWTTPYLQGSQGAFQQSFQNQQQAYQQPVNGLVWVNGPESAMQVQLPPNSTSQPMLNNNGKMEFYVVSTDGTGGKSLETYDYQKHDDTPISVDGAQFRSRREFDEFAAKVYAVMEARNGSYAAVQPVQPVQPAQPEHGYAPLPDAGGHVGGGGEPSQVQPAVRAVPQPAQQHDGGAGV